MNLDKRGLDERQRTLRNRIGNQCFLLLLYGILTDTALHGAGISWIPYPANMMVIVTICAGIYLARIIAGNAYLPPQADKARGRVKVVFLVVLAAAMAALGLLLYGKSAPSQAVPETGDASDVILFVMSAVSLAVALILALVQRARNREREEE